MTGFTRLFIAISFISATPLTGWAEEGAKGAKKGTFCEFLVAGSERIDAEATPLIKGLYNMLAKEFSDLEDKSENSDNGFDVVKAFNASMPALKGEVVSAARLASVSISEISESTRAIAYGIEDRRVSKDALRLERSERADELSRLDIVAQHVSQIRQRGGDTGVEFAKVFRGREAIAHYLKYTALKMRLPLRDSVRDPENSGVVDRDDADDGSTSFNLFLAGYKAIPVSETHSRVTFWMAPLGDPDNGFDVTMPNWVIAPVTSLLGIWVFPGEIGTDIADKLTNLSGRVNGQIHSYIDPDITLSPQVVYSGAAVLGYFGYRLIDKIKKKFASENEVAIEGDTPAKPLPPPPPKLQAVTAQHLAVVKMLIDVARGDQRVGAGNLVHWGTNYLYKDSTLAFDLLLFEQNGEPVLTVVNKEI